MTIKELKKMGACSDSRQWFKQKFGAEGDTVAVLQSALKDKDTGGAGWVRFYFNRSVPSQVQRESATALLAKVITLLPTKKLQKLASEYVRVSKEVGLYDASFDALRAAMVKIETGRKVSLQLASAAIRQFSASNFALSLQAGFAALRFAKNEKANAVTVENAAARELIKILKKYGASKPQPRRKKVAVTFGIEPVTDSDLAAVSQLEQEQQSA